MRDFLTLLLATAAFAHKQMEEATPVLEEPEVDPILESLLGQNDTPRDFMYYLENYQLEMCALAVFAFAIAYLFYGKSKNEQIASEWHLKSLPEIKKQFALVGHNDSTNTTALE